MGAVITVRPGGTVRLTVSGLETREIQRGTVRLILVGHCLVGRAPLEAALTQFCERDDLSPLLDLPGAYSGFVVQPGEVTAFGDLAGQYPVYFSNRAGETVVGTDSAAVAVRHGRPLDPLTMAARIVGGHILPLWEARTLYDGVLRLVGSEVLRIGGTSHVPMLTPLPRFAIRTEFGAAAAALRRALLEAVTLRAARGPLGCDLSGGLDSTSLAVLAAGQTGQRVSTVTYHHPGVPAGDLEAALAAAELPGIAAYFVQGNDESLPFQQLGNATKPTDPTPGMLAQRRSLLRLRKAFELGVTGAYLTGEGGDAVLGAPPSYLSALVAVRRLGTLRRHCVAQARRYDVSPLVLLHNASTTAQRGPARALADLARVFTSNTGSSATGSILDWPDAVNWWPVAGEAVGWLRPRYRKCLAGLATAGETLERIPNGADASDLATLAELRHSADTHRSLRELGEGVGLAVHAPFLDNRVVRACLPVPAWQRAGLGTSKPLLSASLRGMVPDQVFQRHAKGNYTGEEYRGARRAATAIRELLRDPILADLGVIEPDAVRATIARKLAGVRVSSGPLNQLLAIELWLRARESGLE